MKKAYTISINKNVMSEFKTICKKNEKILSHVLEEFIIRYNTGIQKDDTIIENIFKNIMVTSEQLKADITLLKSDISEEKSEVGEF